MKRETTLFMLAAAVLCAVGARAQGQAPSADQTPAAPQTAPQTKEQKKAAWENGVKTDCAAEIAAGGVCAGKDFSTDLMKCLHQNRKKLSDGCKVAVHPHKGSKDHKPAGGAQAPASAPATTPQQ